MHAISVVKLSSSSSFQSCEKTHVGRENNKCEPSTKGFSCYRHLQTHKITNNEEDLYECHQHDKAFRSASSLKETPKHSFRRKTLRIIKVIKPLYVTVFIKYIELILEKKGMNVINVIKPLHIAVIF